MCKRAAAPATGRSPARNNFSFLSFPLRLQLAGRLSRKELLCKAAARSGKLKKLKLLRAGDCPGDAGTCTYAARGGHLEVLQWLRANGCP